MGFYKFIEQNKRIYPGVLICASLTLCIKMMIRVICTSMSIPGSQENHLKQSLPILSFGSQELDPHRP